MSFTYINKAQDVPLKVALIFLVLLAVVGIILVFVFEKQYSSCKNSESPLCITGNCPASSSNCQNIPFKIENGKTICKSSLLNQQDIPRVNFSNTS